MIHRIEGLFQVEIACHMPFVHITEDKVSESELLWQICVDEILVGAIKEKGNF